MLAAGGIGITPMRAMFAHFLAAGLPIVLLYSVRHLQDAAFLHELAKVPLPISQAAGLCLVSAARQLQL